MIPGKSGIMHKNARRTVSLRHPDRDSRPLKGGDSKKAIVWPALRRPRVCSTSTISSRSPVTRQVRRVAASSRTQPFIAGARVIPSTWFVNYCAPHTRRLTPRQQERLCGVFVAEKAHTSVEVAYHCAQQVRAVFHQDTPRPRPTPGRNPH